MGRHKITENTSAYKYIRDQVTKLSKTKNLKDLTGIFVKYSVLFTLCIYLIGTILLLFRSWSENIPFVPLNIVQTAVIDVYFIITISFFLFYEYWSCEIWQLARQSNYGTLKKMLCRSIALFAVVLSVLIMIYIVSLWTKDVFSTAGFFTALFLLIPGYSHLFMTRISVKVTIFVECTWIVALTCSLICNIPMSMGGLAPQHIEYCIDNNPCQSYNYFGNYDNMLVLKNDSTVILKSIDQGTIIYERLEKDTIE